MEGIMNKIMTCIIILTSSALFVCAGRPIVGEKSIATVADPQAGRMLIVLKDINDSSPKAISAGFVVEGRLAKNKKFKSMGKMTYDGRIKKMKITFIDSVFRSPMAIAFQEGTSLKFHLPVEKKMYLDTTDRVDLKYYLNVNVNYSFLQNLAVGKIPLIDGYSVKQGMVQKEGAVTSEHYIILENNLLYETISFNKNIPNRIMLLNKLTKEKTEFYLENPVMDNNVLYYKSIRFISLQSGERINVIFNSFNLNPKLNDSRDFALPVPKGTEIIRIN